MDNHGYLLFLQYMHVLQEFYGKYISVGVGAKALVRLF